jgi:hypothetical protein
MAIETLEKAPKWQVSAFDQEQFPFFSKWLNGKLGPRVSIRILDTAHHCF